MRLFLYDAKLHHISLAPLNTQHTNSLPLVGKRIRLRRLVATDLGQFQSYRNDADVGLYQGWAPMGVVEAMAFIVEMQSSTLFQPGIWNQIAIADVQTDELVGDIGICVASELTEAEIGFTLHQKAQGRGFATEAVHCAVAMLFEHTQITQVLATTDTRNLASIRLLQRIGMSPITTQAAVFKGEPCMEITYALARRNAV
ncbi:MAG: GNAT family protein [Casimicrobium sp.]